jgi:hypothetical protein
LKFTYNVPAGGTAMFKLPFTNNISTYNYVSFWVKGDSGGEGFKVGLKDGGGKESKRRIEDYLPGGVTTEWQKVVVPFTPFDNLTWTSMTDFNITVEDPYDNTSSAIYVDNVVFGRNTGRVWVDDYCDGADNNALNGNQDSMGGDGAEYSFAYDSDNGYRGAGDYCGRLYYNKPFNSWVGDWIQTQNQNAASTKRYTDIRGCDTFSLLIKGGKGGEGIWLALKDPGADGNPDTSDDNYEKKVNIDDYISGGSISTSYKEVTVPLADFTDPEPDRSTLESMNFTASLISASTIYFDEIYFFDNSTPTVPSNFQDDGEAVANGHVFGLTNVLTATADTGETDKTLECVRFEYQEEGTNYWTIIDRVIYDLDDTVYCATWTTTGLSDTSTYTVRVVAQDVHGNEGILAKTDCHVISSDDTAPSAITNLSALTGDSPGQINLNWTAPGDDGYSGNNTQDAYYTLKYATYSVSGSTQTWWDSARTYSQDWTVSAQGTTENKIVYGLPERVTIWFAIKTTDDSNNTSAIDKNTQDGASTQANAVPKRGTGNFFFFFE